MLTPFCYFGLKQSNGQSPIPLVMSCRDLQTVMLSINLRILEAASDYESEVTRDFTLPAKRL